MAGSKPGERRGGRQKGTPNKRTEERARRTTADAALVVEAFRQGVDLSQVPKGVDVMRMAMAVHLRTGNIDRAAAWAKEIAPFESPKLSTVDLNATLKDERSLTDAELLAIAASGSQGDFEAPSDPPKSGGVLH